MFGRKSGSSRGRVMRASAGVAVALVVAIGYACAPAATTWRQRPDFNVISREDLIATHYHDAYDAVQALHSNWLITRPASQLSSDQVQVYYDNVRLGGIDELQAIPIQPIYYMRYFTATEATTRWGLGHTQGVIYVSTHPLDSAANPGI